MTRKIKAIAVVKTDPIDERFVDVEIYGNMKHLQETALPDIPYNRIRAEIKEKGFYKFQSEPGSPDGQLNIMVIPRDLERGERHMV